MARDEVIPQPPEITRDEGLEAVARGRRALARLQEIVPSYDASRVIAGALDAAHRELSAGPGVADVLATYAKVQGLRNAEELDRIIADAARRGITTLSVRNPLLGTVEYDLTPVVDALAHRAPELTERRFLELYAEAWGGNCVESGREWFCGAFDQEFRFAQLVFAEGLSAQGGTDA